MRIREALGDVPSIGGGLSPAKLKDLVARWNRGELPVLCGHPAAMGHGLNLQGGGNHVCWYSTTWDLELYDQTIHRVWRQGIEADRVVVHRILARRTVDEVVMRALRGKRRTQEGLMEALKDYARK